MSSQMLQFLSPDGTLRNDFPFQIPEDQLIKSYQTMLLTRHVDERMIILQRQGAISFCLSSLGEEACSVASAAALELGDWLYPQYREAGAIFYRGLTIAQFVDHMFGNAGDPSLGRQMPNHFGSRELNVVTVSSPIATKIPHAAGAAYAMKCLKEPFCTLAYFGEGATSEGDFHGALNFAAVRKAPAIFFCRNNGYAISTPACRQFASDGVAPKGIGYGIHAVKIDGNDFFAIYAAVKEARKRAVENGEPTLIEAMTYRMGAHSTSDDPKAYRKDEEVEPWKEKCPLLRFRRYLEKRSLWDEQKEKAFLEKVRAETDQAIAKAKATPRSPVANLIEQVWETPPARLKEEFQDLCLK